jgi:hypothetical protein
MNPRQKSTKPEAGAPAVPEILPIDAFANLFHNGVEKLAEIQKATLDMFAVQSADAINAWKQASHLPPATPGMSFADLAERNIENCIEVQKELMNLAVEQSALGVEAAKERGGSVSKLAAGISGLAQQSAEKAVAAEKIMLDFAASQNKMIGEAAKRECGLAGIAPLCQAVESIQHGMEVVIQGQKEAIETGMKAMKAAAAKA